jgi:TPR repeat protein
VGQDYERALHWYREAAARGHAGAQNMLGTVYLTGQGVAKNSAEAERWWASAAEQGYAPSQYNLGGMYSRSLSETLTRDEAMDWLGKAASQGHSQASIELAKLRKEARLDASGGAGSSSESGNL